MKPIHPFPARMAPEIALEYIRKLAPGAVVLDPMAGSGTVLRQASRSGITAVGFDKDPLAVLMSRVATTRCNLNRVEELTDYLIGEAQSIDGRTIYLDWIDGDPETKEFTTFWFGPEQRLALRKIAAVFALNSHLSHYPAEKDFLRIVLSRIIVTKDRGASLARDTSHSRPHRVANENDFDVFAAFRNSSHKLRKILAEETLIGETTVAIGDARDLETVSKRSIDAVITSPPYLNAIDYIRGHRLSLVWMGHTIESLRTIRSNSIGAERAPDVMTGDNIIESIVEAAGPTNSLPNKYQNMIWRYACDILDLMKEVCRVLKSTGRAVFVVGDSTLRGVFVRNSKAIIRAAQQCGLELTDQVERGLPESRRYLPVKVHANNALSRRMRTESILTFQPATT